MARDEQYRLLQCVARPANLPGDIFYVLAFVSFLLAI